MMWFMRKPSLALTCDTFMPHFLSRAYQNARNRFATLYSNYKRPLCKTFMFPLPESTSLLPRFFLRIATADDEDMETIPRCDYSQLAHRFHSIWRSCCTISDCKTILSTTGIPCAADLHTQFHEKFVMHLGWIDEPMYQQIFAISQALPGSASTKMLFCINTIHSGFFAGFLAFALFCLPGALGMYSLALGISKVGNTLPEPVYALLSGLNAATVGIIALAAVRLSERAITDKLTRFLVYLGGIMGMLYTALWYYPVVMVGAGATTLVWDLRYPQKIVKMFQRPKPREQEKSRITSEDLEQGSWFNSSRSSEEYDKPLPPPPPAYSARDSLVSEFAFRHPRPVPQPPTRLPPANPHHDLTKNQKLPPSTTRTISPMSWPLGTTIILFFLVTFILTITLHALLQHTTSQAFSLFSSLYLAGTIIFGGGPVVIPLLREYIVTPGWVTPRDFLLGLAVIQAFPGPNFNFAIYLGALAVASTPVPSYLGALIAFVAMYAPGLFIVIGFMGLWRLLRDKNWFLAVLRGVNAAAVGLVFTAVYKLWQIGQLTQDVQGGSPLGGDPWLVAITGTAFVGGAWFGMNPPLAILLGGAMGVGRWGIFNK